MSIQTAGMNLVPFSSKVMARSLTKGDKLCGVLSVRQRDLVLFERKRKYIDKEFEPSSIIFRHGCDRPIHVQIWTLKLAISQLEVITPGLRRSQPEAAPTGFSKCLTASKANFRRDPTQPA